MAAVLRTKLLSLGLVFLLSPFVEEPLRRFRAETNSLFLLHPILSRQGREHNALWRNRADATLASVAQIAEIVKGNNVRAGIVWPILLRNGRILDDDIVLMQFERFAGAWWYILELPSDYSGRTQLEIAGEDKKLHVIKPDGVPMKQMPHFIRAHSIRFRQAIQSRDMMGAARAFETLSRAFGVSLGGKYPVLVGLTIHGTFADNPPFEIRDFKRNGEEGRGVIVWKLRGKERKYRAVFKRWGTGWTLDRFIHETPR